MDLMTRIYQQQRKAVSIASQVTAGLSYDSNSWQKNDKQNLLIFFDTMDYFNKEAKKAGFRNFKALLQEQKYNRPCDEIIYDGLFYWCKKRNEWAHGSSSDSALSFQKLHNFYMGAYLALLYHYGCTWKFIGDDEVYFYNKYGKLIAKLSKWEALIKRKHALVIFDLEGLLNGEY